VLYDIFMLVAETAAAVLATILLIRFWMQATRVRPPSQIAGFIFVTSDWLVKPLRKITPGSGGYDWASLVAAYLVALAVTVLIFTGAGFPLSPVVLLLALIRLVNWIVYGFMGLLLIDVVLSWVNPHAPMAPLIRALTDPLLRPLRRVIPPLGGIDLSPLVAFLLLRIVLYAFERGLPQLL
jgi:YggT family protein